MIIINNNEPIVSYYFKEAGGSTVPVYCPILSTVACATLLLCVTPGQVASFYMGLLVVGGMPFGVCSLIFCYGVYFCEARSESAAPIHLYSSFLNSPFLSLPTAPPPPHPPTLVLQLHPRPPFPHCLQRHRPSAGRAGPICQPA